MLIHYLKFFIRDIARNKLYAFINLTGLVIGLALTFLLLLYVVHEVNYDKTNKNYDRIYRVTSHELTLDRLVSETPYPMGVKLKQMFPEIEEAVTITSQVFPLVKIGEEFVKVPFFCSADNSILKVLTFPMIESNGANPLDQPSSIIINKQWSEKIFGNENPMGKTITLKVGSDIYVLMVTGLMDKVPTNRTFTPSMIANIDFGLSTIVKSINYSDTSIVRDANHYRTSFDEWWFTTYLLLRKGADYKELEKKIEAVKSEFQPSRFYKHDFMLQPMREFHFSSITYVDDNFDKGIKSNIYIYSGVGMLILLIAISNYLILSLARSTARLKEYGVRKITGGSGIDLLRQTIRESMLFAVLAFPLAITLAEILLPSVNNLFELEMEIRYSQNLPFVIGMLVITIITGLLSSTYLAIVASKSNPIEIFKTGFSTKMSRSTLMKTLIVLQLVVFISLLNSVLIVYKQIDFAREKSPGYNKENLISVIVKHDSGKNYYKVFKEILSENTGVVEVTGTMWELPTNFRMDVNNSLPGKPETDITADGLFVDYNFIDVLGIPIIKGESFNESMNMNEYPVIVNKAFVEKMQLENPVGTKLNWGKIVGVVDNFQLHSVHKPIGPTLLFYNLHSVRCAIIRIKPGKIMEVVDFIKKKWNELVPEQPARISFFDDSLEKLYNEEKRFKTIVLLFTITSIFIAGMGLFGLAMFISKRRTKEIGVRKVLGARDGSIAVLIVREFLLLVFIAGATAIPITIYFMNKWLSGFAYHIPLKPFYFIVSILIALAIVVVTLLMQTLKAARSNPVESLRYE